MTMFELSNATDDFTRLIRADELDMIESSDDSVLLVYLTDGTVIECDFFSHKEIEG